MIKMFKEIWGYRTMIQTLVRRDLRGRYKASVLGFLWTFIIPLCQLLVYTLVFSVIMRSDIEKYYLFLFVALIPWNFFANCLTGGANCIVQQQALVTKIYFPREVIPISYVTSAFVNMLYCGVVVVAVCIFSGIRFSPLGLLCLPLVMLLEYALALGFTMIFSALTVYLRDIEHILGIISMAWMFMTPIMYKIDQVPDSVKCVFHYNPMTPIVTAYRDILYAGTVPKLNTLVGAVIWAAISLVAGFLIFERMKRRFAEEM